MFRSSLVRSTMKPGSQSPVRSARSAHTVPFRWWLDSTVHVLFAGGCDLFAGVCPISCCGHTSSYTVEPAVHVGLFAGVCDQFAGV